MTQPKNPVFTNGRKQQLNALTRTSPGQLQRSPSAPRRIFTGRMAHGYNLQQLRQLNTIGALRLITFLLARLDQCTYSLNRATIFHPHHILEKHHPVASRASRSSAKMSHAPSLR